MQKHNAQANPLIAVRLAEDDRWVYGIAGAALTLGAGRAASKFIGRTVEAKDESDLLGQVANGALTLASAYVTFKGIVMLKNAATGVKYDNARELTVGKSS